MEIQSQESAKDVSGNGDYITVKLGVPFMGMC
jgi:hypothetical protein